MNQLKHRDQCLEEYPHPHPVAHQNRLFFLMWKEDNESYTHPDVHANR